MENPLPVTGHGALALLPTAGRLIEARRRFNAPATAHGERAEAARTMIQHGGAFDIGTARAWLRDQGLRP